MPGWGRPSGEGLVDVRGEVVRGMRSDAEPVDISPPVNKIQRWGVAGPLVEPLGGVQSNVSQGDVAQGGATSRTAA